MKLDIARAKVVHDCIAGDVVLRLPFVDVLALASNDTGQFQLIVQLRGFQWPGQVFVRPNNGPVIPLVVNRRFVPFRRNRLPSLLRRGGNVVFEGDKVSQRRRIEKRSGNPNVGRLIKNRFACRAFACRTEHDGIVESPPSRCQRRRTPFEKLQHGCRHLGIGQALRLRFTLVGQPASIGHIHVDNALATHRAHSHEGANRSCDLETDEFHRRLQLSA